MDNKKTLQYIAGGCFAVAALLMLLSMRYFSVLQVAQFLAMALIAAAIFIPLPLLLTIGSGLGALFKIARAIQFLCWGEPFVVVVIELLYGAFFAALLIASLNKKYAKTLGLVAAAVYAVRTIAVIINIVSNGSSVTFKFVLLSVALAAGAVLLGMVFDQLQPVKKEKAVAATTAKQAVDASSQLDKLTKLKGLLDNGIISQEEFDEKKKQLLGL